MAETDLKEGHIRYRTIIEILGKPKDHIEKTIKEYVDQIKEDNSFIILSEHYSDAVEKDALFSIFAELEMIAKGIHPLVGFCFDYMPSSIEIIKPEQFLVHNNSMAGFLNDLQARLHKVDMIVKQMTNENIFLKTNLNRALKNQIVILLKIKERSHDELSRLTGIHNDLEAYLNQMIKDNEIRKENDLYYCIK